MKRYLRLAENERTQRRTVSDALSVLQSLPGFTNDSHTKIVLKPFRLPSGQIVSLVDLELCDGDDLVFVASLPSSTEFRALRQSASRHQRFEIGALDCATVDASGVVRLIDGTILRSVEIVPAHLPYEPSELDWRIICHLISMHNAKDRCAPRWRDKAPIEIRDMTPPYLRSFDCSEIAKLKAPPLKVLASYIADHDTEHPTPSMQKISDALATFGVRMRARRRRHTRPNVATV